MSLIEPAHGVSVGCVTVPLPHQVCCITYRADVFSCALFLSSLLAYVACESTGAHIIDTAATGSAPRWQYRAQFLASLVCGVAALLCKEQGVTVFGVVVAYDGLRVIQRGHVGGHTRAAVERVALCVLTLTLLLVARLRMNFGPSPR